MLFYIIDLSSLVSFIVFKMFLKINEINSDKSVNRTLNTENIEFNNLLWMNAGYDHVPTIEENIKELAESDISKGILS